jgi:hypothetical protein
MAGNNRSSYPRTHLRISAEEPFERGGVWEIVITSLLSRSGKIVEGEEIQFFLDGMRYGLPVLTSLDGRANETVKVPLGAKRVSVEAQVVNQPWVARTIVTLPFKKAPLPKAFEVHFIGADGKYRVVGMVRGENNVPLKGVRVNILNAASGAILHTMHTDASGNFMLVKNIPPGEILEIEVFVRGLHALNNPTLLRLVGEGVVRVPKTPEPREQPKLNLAESFKDGLVKRRREKEMRRRTSNG